MKDINTNAASEDERIRNLITAGTQILGGSSSGAVSAAVGLLLAGPPGAVVGGAAG